METTEKNTEKQTEKHTGFLGKDASFRELDNGSKVVNIDIGIPGATKDSPPTWVKAAFWNDLAEVSKNLTKSQRITIEGERKSNPQQKGEKTYQNEYIEVKTFSISNAKEIEGELKSSPELKKINGSDALEFTVKANGEESKMVIFKDLNEIKDLKVGDKIHYKAEEKTSFYRNKENELKENKTLIGKENQLGKSKEKDTSVSM